MHVRCRYSIVSSTAARVRALATGSIRADPARLRELRVGNPAQPMRKPPLARIWFHWCRLVLVVGIPVALTACRADEPTGCCSPVQRDSVPGPTPAAMAPHADTIPAAVDSSSVPRSPRSAGRDGTIAEWLLALQFRDPALPSFGAVRLHHTPGWRSGGGDYHVVRPYDTNLGLSGLLRTRSLHRLKAVERWIEWYLARVDTASETPGVVLDHWYRADGTGETTCLADGSGPGTPPCDHVDASDSAAGTFLNLVWQYHAAGGSRARLSEPWVRDRLRVVAQVIVGLQQPDGLTWAKADFPAKYLMDNCESYQGLMAMAHLERELYGDASAAASLERAAKRIQSGILSSLYNPVTGNFRVGKHSDGTVPEPDLRRWYPDAAAQAWPRLFGVVDGNSTFATSAWANLNQAWNGETGPSWWSEFVDPTEDAPWTSIGFASILMGDPARAAAHAEFIVRTHGLDASTSDGFRWPFAVRDAGWLLMTLRALEQNASVPR